MNKDSKPNIIKRYPVIFWGVVVLILVLVPFIAIQVIGRGNSEDLSNFTFLFSPAHEGIEKVASSINAGSLPNLHLIWRNDTGSAISIQPIIQNDTLYWGGWDGIFHATSLNGKDIWKQNLGTTTVKNCDPPNEVGIASSPSIANIQIDGQNRKVIIVGGGDGYLYTLDESNGKILWRTQIGASPNNFIWSSPVLYNNNIYIGDASFGDCPLVGGELLKLDATSGKILNTFSTVPSGCIGAAIWSTPTINTEKHTIYISTGNASTGGISGPTCNQFEDNADAIIELNADNLKEIGSWHTLINDQDVDSDFGATPTLFTASLDGKKTDMVGDVNKNGIFYAFIQDQISNGPVWQKQVAVQGDCVECGDGSISTAAWDGSTLYVAGGNTIILGKNCPGSLRAISPNDGNTIWEYCALNNPIISPVIIVNDLVVIEEGGSVHFINKDTGHVVSTQTPSAVSSLFASPPAISNNLVVFGNLDGGLFTYGI